MKKIAISLLIMAGSTSLFAQSVSPCSQTTSLTGGTTVSISTESQKTGTISGTDYEYELWHNTGESTNTVSMKYYGSNQGGGAAFRGDWKESNTKFDYLARIGYKFEKNGSGSGKLYTDYDDIYADYNYTRSSRLTGSNYSYIGIYGWARAGTDANLVEFYIVDDWWGNQYTTDTSPVTSSTTGGSIIGTATIDGASYQIIKNSRTGQPSIEGNNTNFDQYFSVRQTPRKCGTISITDHFKAWEEKGLKLGKLYEAKILAEVGAYSASSTEGWIEYTYASMRMGGSSTSSSSSNSTGGGTTPSSSSSTGGTTTSSSSSSAPVQATNCNNFIGELPANPNPPTNAYTACFKHTNNKCYVCKISNESDGNTCASTWVWDGDNVDDNLDKGYWYSEVTCPATSSSSAQSSSSSLAASSSSSNASNSSSSLQGNSSSSSSEVKLSSSSEDNGGDINPITVLNTLPAKFKVKSLGNGSLLVESNANIAIYLYNAKGKVAQKIQAPIGSSIVKLSVPAGLYVVKNAKTKQTQVVVVK